MKRLLTILALAIGVAAIFVFQDALDLRALIDSLQIKAQTQPLLTGLIYFGIYVLVAALSIPGAAILTLAGGAIFGLLWGTVLVSFASTIGASFAFLAARWLVGRRLQQRFASQLQTINDGIARDGGFYLFTLRLVPLFPFFIVNLVMGLSHLRTTTFYWISQIGMLPGTIIYVNAGAQAADINKVGGLLSPPLIISLVALGVFPLAVKKLLDVYQRQR